MQSATFANISLISIILAVETFKSKSSFLIVNSCIKLCSFLSGNDTHLIVKRLLYKKQDGLQGRIQTVAMVAKWLELQQSDVSIIEYYL